jgi:UDP-glucuronate 4-epimerase
MTLKTVLITGGAGFIGSHLADRLLAHGDRVIVLDNFDDFYNPAIKRHNIESHQNNPNYALIEGDIRDREGVLSLFREYQPGHVMHLAAMANVRYSTERAHLYGEVNLQGTINILDGARETGTTNLVMASTSAVYGRTEQVPFKEDLAVNQPLAPYPATKKACELMAYSYHNLFDMNVTALRFFNVYGPRLRPDTMAWIVMQALTQEEPFILYNKGDLHRDWTYIDDIIDGVVAALDNPLGYEIINLGRGEPVRLGDFVDILQEFAGTPAQIVHKPAPPSEAPITYASVEKANTLLNYQPRVSIHDGLAQTWNWYRTLTESLARVSR